MLKIGTVVLGVGDVRRGCNNALARLTALGYDVTLTPKEPAA